MTVTQVAGAAPNLEVGWHDIDWAKAHKEVRRLQARIVKAVKEGRWNKVKVLQRLLTSSFSGKAIAVKRVTENKGKRTPGVDGEQWNTPADKSRAVSSLKRHGYQPKPLKRVYIPKANGKTRPLGIPTMKDRAMQALYLLALEPIAETTADPNSYGFRKARSTRDAAAQIYIVQSRKDRAQWTLEADIAGCFDNISHDWLLANIPIDKVILGKWLKAGYMEKHSLFSTEAGTPQGGIISPTLANMTLNGLEGAIHSHIGKMGPKEKKKAKVNVVRYADDFIVTASSRWRCRLAKQAAKEFLEVRGLKLSQEKTHCTHIETGYDFLGWNIRKYKGKFLIKPSKKNVKAHLHKIRTVIKEMNGSSQKALVDRLNPIIRGWSGYHASQVSKKTFSKVDHRIWQALWKWAKRRHPHKGKQWIKDRYFYNSCGRDWVFGYWETTQDGSKRFVRLLTHAETPIRRHIKIKADANPFDPEWDSYFEQRETNAMKKAQKGRVKSLWLRQEGTCPICHQMILVEEEEWAIHHIHPKSLGGSDALDNLRLLHGNCHRLVHSKHTPRALPAL